MAWSQVCEKGTGLSVVAVGREEAVQAHSLSSRSTLLRRTRLAPPSTPYS